MKILLVATLSVVLFACGGASAEPYVSTFSVECTRASGEVLLDDACLPYVDEPGLGLMAIYTVVFPGGGLVIHRAMPSSWPPQAGTCWPSELHEKRRICNPEWHRYWVTRTDQFRFE